MNNGQLLDVILPKILKLKQELKGVKKDGYNPHFKSHFADLNSHLDAVEPLAHKNGLVLLQPVQGTRVTSALFCVESGQSVISTVDLPPLTDMQKIGGAITYARRYTLSALLSMQAEDDDGNTAADVEQEKPKKKPTKKKAVDNEPGDEF